MFDPLVMTSKYGEAEAAFHRPGFLFAFKLDTYLSQFRSVECQRSEEEHILEFDRAMDRTARERRCSHFQISRSREKRLARLQSMFREQPLLLLRELTRVHNLLGRCKQPFF